MAVVPLTTPYALKTATLTLGSDDYTAAVSQVLFTPSTSTSTWTGIGGNVISDLSTASWTVAIGYAQDLAPTGLTRYLLDHAGEKVPAVFTPKSGGPAINATVTLTPGAIGGTAGADLSTATATFAVDGAPVFNDAP